ncbi:sulfur oxidation c-type cytochrome SoxX [Polynucleobacter meluiroseus]|nr:sulfur oxidation c-type cytochrome SoxX [Polynucleobacter meluiroseus]
MKTHFNKCLALCLFLTMSSFAHSQANLDAQFEKILSTGFRAQGIAGMDRIKQDPTQQFCSKPQLSNSKAALAQAAEIEKRNMASITQPTDGQYLGNWQQGELVAQSGRGLTWSDSANAVNGGGCYNCHEINRKEISYGNIGPSLWNYGKLRGYSDEVIRYTWNRINNSKAYNACSNMPRFGHFKILTQQQMQDVMALLLDPLSPVNQ